MWYTVPPAFLPRLPFPRASPMLPVPLFAVIPPFPFPVKLLPKKQPTPIEVLFFLFDPFFEGPLLAISSNGLESIWLFEPSPGTSFRAVLPSPVPISF